MRSSPQSGVYATEKLNAVVQITDCCHSANHQDRLLGQWPGWLAFGTETSDSAHVTEAECVSSSLVGYHGPVAETLSHHDSGGSECALSQGR